MRSDFPETPGDRAATDAFIGGDTRVAAGESLVVPVVAESLQVERRLVDTGRGVRIHKRVHEDVVRFDEPLRADALHVERVAVGRTVDAHPPVRYEGDTMILPVVAERVVMQVVLELVEEIRITRTQSSRVDPQDVVLRREEVVVERFDDDRSAASGDV